MFNQNDTVCGCGEWAGSRCCGTLGPDAVTVEYMPEQHRAAHGAARNSGRYPHNGAVRVRVTPECAEAIVESDGEWARIVNLG